MRNKNFKKKSEEIKFKEKQIGESVLYCYTYYKESVI